MVKIQTSDKFERILNKLDKSLKLQIDKLLDRIIANPEVGKPMRYERKGTRELYLGSHRLAYAYDQATDTLFLLNIYHKNEQ